MDSFLKTVLQSYFAYRMSHATAVILQGQESDMEVESILAEKELIRVLTRPLIRKSSDQINSLCSAGLLP